MKRVAIKVRYRLMAFFLIIIAIYVVSFSVFSIYYGELEKNFNQKFSEYVLINDAYLNFSETHNNLKDYFSERNLKDLEDYESSLSYAQNSLTEAERSRIETKDLRMIIDLKNMLKTYQEKSEVAITNLRNNISMPYSLLEEPEFVKGLIVDSFNRYFTIRINDIQSMRLALSQKTSEQNKITVILIIVSMFFGIILSNFFSRSISRPIYELKAAFEQMSHGNLNIDPISVPTQDEFGSLANSANEMVRRLRYYISEMEEKSAVEKKLLEEEKELLQTKDLLKETQINALQAKMNPHFLFNALNIVAQTAYIENAETTNKLLTAFSGILRYNLDKSGTTVYIHEEVQCVRDYMYIQKMRFGDRIKFEIDVDPALPEYRIPSLTIQPMVENAVIHGLENTCRGGTIRVKIAQYHNGILITVTDDGKGMAPEKAKRLLQDEAGLEPARKSIGIRNVHNRLKLLYGSSVNLEIESEPGKGTKVTMFIPGDKQEGERI